MASHTVRPHSTRLALRALLVPGHVDAILEALESPGAVFGPDEDLFDVVLDNSCFIPAATSAGAQHGVAAFNGYLLAAVQAAGGQVDHLDELRARHPDEFRRVVRFVRGISL